jgi:signal transduction histidine kinase
VGRVLIVACVLVGVLFLFTALDLAAHAQLWENAHLTAAGLAASWVAWIGVTRADPWARNVRFWAAVALTLWTAGQVVWDVQALAGRPMLPGPADIFWLATVVPVFLAFRASFTSRLRRAQELAVYLDAGAVFWAVIAALIVSLGESAEKIGGIAGFLVLLYPALFLGLAGASFVSALANRTQLRAAGAYALLGGFLILGAAQTWLAATSATHSVTPGQPVTYLIPIGLLILGFGAATWSDRVDLSARLERIAEVLQKALPVAALFVAAFIALVAEAFIDGIPEVAVHAAVVVVVVCTGFRQALLLADRSSMVRQLRSTHRDLMGAVDRAERAALEERRIADERGRVLAASQRLLTGGDLGLVLTDVLSLIVPPGATGFISRWEEDGASLRVVAVHGPAPDDLAGRVTRVADLPPDVGALYLDPKALGYSARGEAFVPADLAPHRYFYERVVPTAESTLTLPFLAASGAPLGSLSLIDPAGERVLEPQAIDFARLVANQIAVALQNNDLIERLRTQIDEISRVQDQLVQASKMTAIGELAAAVAHEINNPLTGVLGYADLMLTEAPSDDPAREGLQVIRDEAIRARTVVWALLDFARPRPPERRAVDVGALMRSTLNLMRYHLEGGGVRVVEEYGDLPLVELDESAIRQVLLNLITNAGQAMPGSGTLTLKTGRDGDNAVITIADDGDGMSDAVHKRIFEPFFTTKPMQSGRGLGLPVSLGLVESHGGTIRVLSALGQGTTIEVRLPIRAPTPALAPATHADQAPRTYQLEALVS